ncbi:hypothetical protein Bbelb_172540 [Branchiostoma belcheri]|nr:hypothetical protein Bbelb_172540 [Branchiostoma belcheri]
MRHYGVLTSDPKEKVDALGDQFSSVFTEEDLTNIPSLGRPVAPHAPPLYISVIFTQSLDTGDVPADGRAANISPIFKKGDKTSPVNYRPVSLTSFPTLRRDNFIVLLTKTIMSLVELIGYWQSSAVTFRTVLFVSNLHATEHLYAHTWSTVRLYGIPTPSVVPRRWSESNEGRREWLTINEWNKLPGQLVKAQTVEAFKAGLLAAQP